MRLTNIHEPINEITGTLSRMLGNAQLGLARDSTVKKLLAKYPRLNKIVDRSGFLSGSLLHPDYAKWWFNLVSIFGVPKGEKGEVVDTLIGRISPRINRAREKIASKDTNKSSGHQDRTISNIFGGGHGHNILRGGLRHIGRDLFGHHGKTFKNSTETTEDPISEKLSDVENGWLDQFSPTRRKQIIAAKHRRINNERIALMAIKLLYDEYGETPLQEKPAEKPGETGEEQPLIGHTTGPETARLEYDKPEPEALPAPGSPGPSAGSPGPFAGSPGPTGPANQSGPDDELVRQRLEKLVSYLDKASKVIIQNAHTPRVGRFVTSIVSGLESIEVTEEFMPIISKLGKIIRSILRNKSLPDTYRQYYGSLIPRLKALVAKTKQKPKTESKQHFGDKLAAIFDYAK